MAVAASVVAECPMEKAGDIVFIPEEVHQINKDSSLKMVENGATVTAGTEIVKDVYSHIDGVVEYL